MKVMPEGLVLTEIAPGVTVEEVQAKTGTLLAVSPALCVMNVS